MPKCQQENAKIRSESGGSIALDAMCVCVLKGGRSECAGSSLLLFTGATAAAAPAFVAPALVAPTFVLETLVLETFVLEELLRLLERVVTGEHGGAQGGCPSADGNLANGNGIGAV